MRRYHIPVRALALAAAAGTCRSRLGGCPLRQVPLAVRCIAVRRVRISPAARVAAMD